MAGCSSGNAAWQVRVCDAYGETVGAGVLLGTDRVLTCAHVVNDAAAGDGRVRIDSVLCLPRWSRSATVIPGCWVLREGTQRGDLALLQLDAPVTCHSGARLQRTPVRDVEVRVHGFPDGDRVGVTAEGKLVGLAYDGDWVEMHPLGGERAQWITRGFSGAGVIESRTGSVVGMVIAVRETGGLVNAWMMPADRIAWYLPAVRPFTHGPGGIPEKYHSLPVDVPPDTGVDATLRAEVRRLFAGTWSGVAVVTSGAGRPWLARLVASSDPVIRQRMPDAVSARETILDIGTVDLALSAEDCTVDQVCEQIATRFGLQGGDWSMLADRLVHRRPPPVMVIDQVDRARDPGALAAELLKPLAERARRHGLRLVLGFAGQPPPDLPYELSLGPEPVAGAGNRRVGADEVRRALAGLAKAESNLLDLYAEVSRVVAGARRPPPSLAPRLRVRAEVADAVELAAISEHAAAARRGVADARDELTRLKTEHAELRETLDAYQNRASARFGAEDARLGVLHSAALATLRGGRCDLGVARRAVDAYIDAVRERLSEPV